MITRAQIAERARLYVGHRETSPNDSRLIRVWLRRCGIHAPAAWCAAFASWCVEEREEESLSGSRIVTVAQAGALKLGALFDETSEPQPGDLMFFATDDRGHGHVGIVVDTRPDKVLCVEGNSANMVRLVIRLREQVRFANTRPAEAWVGSGVATAGVWARAPLVPVSYEGTR